MSKLLRPRLGRGLNSLISVSELPIERELPRPSEEPTVSADPAELQLTDSAPLPVPAAVSDPDIHAKSGAIELPVDQISVNPYQPRRQMNESALAELAASLKGTGLIQPVIVRRVGGRYELIAGERRWRAAQLAGLKTIPVVIKDVDAFTQAQMALVENIQRENLNPIDRALAYRALINQLGLTQAELAQRLGEDRSVIANHLRLLDLSESVRMSVIDGRLSLGHAKLLAGVPDILEQNRLANLVVSQELSVRSLEKLIQQQATRQPPIAATAAPSAHLLDLERTLSRQLGLRVQIRPAGRSKTKGRLVCHFANLDQFDELMTKLGLRTE